MMTKLNLNISLTDNEGKQINPTTSLAKVLGRSMLQSSNVIEADILKFFTWALLLGKDGVIELDKADSIFLKKYIVDEPNLFILVKAPLLNELEKLKF